MNDFPFVSIIITSFNGRHYLEECLSSVFGLNYPHDRLEVILVDDNSTDATYEFVKERFSNIKIIRNNVNRGVSESRNAGISSAKGELLAFVDNDVRVDADWLVELIKAIKEEGQAAICSSKILLKDRPGILNSTGGVMNIYADAWDRGVFEKDNGQYDEDKRVFFGCTAAMIARKNILEKIGNFDPDLRIYEDVDLGWRVNLSGYKVIYAPRAIAHHKLGGTIKRDNLGAIFMLENARINVMLKNYEYRTLLNNACGLFKFKSVRFKRQASKSRYLISTLLICALAAWAWNIIILGSTLKKRKTIEKTRVLRDKEILRLLGQYQYKSFEL